ncbi:MAG: hypothetical protein KA116_02195 [Proteobacteria bacterium]|nr:hypothetical protein [Pseudomonadota bacterium]
MKKLFLSSLMILGLIGIQNCGKKIDSNANQTVTGISPNSPKVSNEWVAMDINTISVLNTMSGVFRVESSQGDYNVGDQFNFNSTELTIEDVGGEWSYYGRIMKGTDGSFHMYDMPSAGRTFYLRNAYKKGNQVAFYYEYYDSTSDTDSEYYDGYIIIVK